MSDSLKADRERIHAAIQASGAPSEQEGALTGALCTGWVMVAEFAGTDGRRWLTRLDSDNSTTWSRQGLLHDALYGDWDDDAPPNGP